jgi:hypothetical protein
MKTVIPHPLLDELAAVLKTKTDAQLAKAIDLQPSQISKMRHGVIGVNDECRIKIMRKMKWPLRRLDELAPPAGQDAAED